MKPKTRTLSPAEVAEMVGLTERQIRRLAEQGKVKHRRRGIGSLRRYRILASEVQRLKSEYPIER